MALEKNFSILMAGGGTGGHLFPGIALAKAFQEKNPETKIHFFVPGTSVDKMILSSTHFSFTMNPMRSLPKSYTKYCDFFCRFFLGWHKTFHAFRRCKPDLVVGLGGYGAFSAGYVSQKYNIPLVLLEANRIAGKAVKYLSKDCERIYTSGEIQGVSGAKVRPLGIPIRFSNLQGKSKNTADKKSTTILVMGGSLGAQCINEALVKALPFLVGLKNKIKFIHLCGKDAALIEKEYQKNGLAYQVYPFYQNMEELYLASDIVVSRSGGSTLSEITAMGMPSILVPFARSADGHQEANALAMEKAKASLVIREAELTGELLASKVEELVLGKEKISLMSSASLSLAKPFAARDIVCDIYDLLEKRNYCL